MSKARKVSVQLPDPILPGADWADAFEIDVPDRRLAAIDATAMTLGRIPRWARGLMAARNALGRIVGLKTGAEPPPSPDERRIGMFPVLSATEQRVVLGFDDWHLDFRIVIDVAAFGDSGTRLRATTLVRRKNLFGRLYIGLVTPFHRLIVPATLRGAVA